MLRRVVGVAVLVVVLVRKAVWTLLCNAGVFEKEIDDDDGPLRVDVGVDTKVAMERDVVDATSFC